VTAEELRRAGQQLFGADRGWQTRFADALGVDRASLTRWLSGSVPIPGPVQAAVKCWIASDS
jgi:hypothetical protein